MIKVDLLKDNRMFRRAWVATVGQKPKLSVEVSRQLWLENFGCKMIEDNRDKFVTAIFERDEDYTAFVLKWS